MNGEDLYGCFIFRNCFFSYYIAFSVSLSAVSGSNRWIAGKGIAFSYPNANGTDTGNAVFFKIGIHSRLFSC